MITGPEHYREAGRLLTDVSYDRETYDDEIRTAAIARAQVHAILALAAAVGTYGAEERSREDMEAWERAAGEFTRQAPMRAEFEARERAEEQAAREAEKARLAEENEAEYFGAADAERWAEENAANQYDAGHYNVDDGAEDDVPFASLSGEQANGNACRVCGGEFKPGEAVEPSGYVLEGGKGGQLFAHSACVESEA